MMRLDRVYTPTVEERVDWHLEDGTEMLYVLALRHRFIHRETGEVRRARCDRWSCLYCGPRKVDMWRQVIAEAEPTLHIVLTKAGKTMEEAACAMAFSPFFWYLPSRRELHTYVFSIPFRLKS